MCLTHWFTSVFVDSKCSGLCSVSGSNLQTSASIQDEKKTTKSSGLGNGIEAAVNSRNKTKRKKTAHNNIRLVWEVKRANEKKNAKHKIVAGQQWE